MPRQKRNKRSKTSPGESRVDPQKLAKVKKMYIKVYINTLYQDIDVYQDINMYIKISIYISRYQVIYI